MSKKMKMPSIFKNKESKRQPWQWPSCNHPKTLSFRATNDDVLFKTVNSAFLDTSDRVETPESWFTNSSECASTFSTDEYSDDMNNNNNASSVEMIIQGVRLSDRLFFEPGGETKSILKESKTMSDVVEGGADVLPFKESVALALESDDPYSDFKKSMQEMVESHGLKEWDCLEELLRWYLKMNGKTNHGFIVGAFVDMLVGTADDSSTVVCCSEESTSYSSADSCFSCPSSPLSLSPTGGGVIVGHHQNIVIDEQGGDAVLQS